MKTLCAPTVKTDAYTVFSKMLKEDILLPTGKASPKRQKKTIDGVHNARRNVFVLTSGHPFSLPDQNHFNPSLSQSFQTIRRNAFINNDHVDTLSINDLM